MAIKATSRNLKKQLQTVLTREIVKYYGKTFEKRIVTAFNKIKKEMIDEFLNHPVTVEIRNGFGAENVSGTLGGYGNLFSFIGFDEGTDPTDNIQGILNLSKIERTQSGESGFTMTISIPSKEDIFKETEMPWAKGRSWAEGIERGISGFGQYLNTEAISSRSGEGVQTKAQIRKGKFKNTPYISALLRKYSKKFQQLNNVIVTSGIL